MKRAIISGATGAIGTALTKELVNQEVEVLILVRKDSNRIANIIKHPLVSFQYCSLDELSVMQNTTDMKYDVFYHFAWAGAVGPGRHDMYLQNQNVKYALDAVGVAKRFGCDTFIGAGSQAEYGRFEGVLKANTPTFPEMGYGYAKLCAGQMTREYAHELGLRHIWVRILSVYGPNDGLQSMVMSTIDKLEKGEVPQFTKGEQMWDYLHSGDAASAFRLIGENGVDGKIYVLGSGQAKPLAEYIKEIRREVNPNCEINLGAIPYAEKQVMFLCADIKDIVNDTGWTPKMIFSNGINEIMRIK